MGVAEGPLGPLGTAKVALAVGFTDTSGVLVAVAACGVMPAPTVGDTTGAPGDVESCAFAV